MSAPVFQTVRCPTCQRRYTARLGLATPCPHHLQLHPTTP